MAKKRTRFDGEKMRKVMVETGMKALRAQGEVILTRTIPDTPVDTGTLRRSGTVTVGGLPQDPDTIFEEAKPVNMGGKEMSHIDTFPEPIGEQTAVFISFNTPYALLQHEELDFNHPKGGKALYLVDQFNMNKGKAMDYVRRKVLKALEDAQ